MAFSYARVIRFHETDAAGVVYFANVLTLCHEAYEASLAAGGIDLKAFFSGRAVAVPVVHASVDFRRPIFCGDAIAIHLAPTLINDSTFEIAYQLYPDNGQPGDQAATVLAQAVTRHVCIDAKTRQRSALTETLHHWLTQWSAPAPGDD